MQTQKPQFSRAEELNQLVHSITHEVAMTKRMAKNMSIEPIHNKMTRAIDILIEMGKEAEDRINDAKEEMECQKETVSQS